MLRKLLILVLFFTQVCLSVSAPQDEASSKENGLSGVLDQAGKAYRYVKEAYNEALESIVTSQPWKTASENLPTGFLMDSLSGTKAAVSKVKDVGETLLGFAGMYYEDHIKPITDHYIEQASNKTTSIWEGISNSWDRFWQS